MLKKSIGIVTLVIAVLCFDSPIAIALTGILTTVSSFFINAYPNAKLIDYSFSEQLKDLVPSMILTAIMCCTVMMLGKLSLSALPLMLLQIILGIALYLALSVVFRPEPFRFLVEQITHMKKDENGK